MPLVNRKVGVSVAASNWSEAFTIPRSRSASSFSDPRCVVARTVQPRAARAHSTLPARAAPSAGSVPVPSSSRSTSDAPSAPSSTSLRAATCALNVERLSWMLCRSPMSAYSAANTGSRVPGPTGGITPLCASATISPTALSRTVLPPALGPDTRTVRSSGSSSRSKGTAARSAPASSGCAPRTMASGPAPASTTSGRAAPTPSAKRARAEQQSTAMSISNTAAAASA
jgi:hypothetical protein